MPGPSVANSSRRTSARAAGLIFISSSALPPVSAKPKPSIAWNACASSTTIAGPYPASSVNGTVAGCRAHSMERSGFVSQTSIGPGAPVGAGEVEEPTAAASSTAFQAAMRQILRRPVAVFSTWRALDQSSYAHRIVASAMGATPGAAWSS